MSHKSSVSCIAIPNNTKWQVFSGCHDGNIYLWDVRMNQILREITNAHQRKYDEGIQTLTLIEDKQLLVSGGADSLIKVFQY